MNPAVARIVGGFLAGALAVLIFHQGMYLLIQQLQKAQMLGAPLLSGVPWNMSPDANAFGMPRTLNQAFWGGLWGIVFAHLINLMPGPNVVRGFVFGCIFPMLLGSWLIVSLIKGQPLFADAFGKNGFNIMRLRNGFLLNGVGFGIGLGILYPIIAGWFGQARQRTA